jgi:DNA-binding transcriptional LysR family regulator
VLERTELDSDESGRPKRVTSTQLRRLDLNLLLIFAAIGRYRKLSAAADELNLTKSAISHALTRLRDIFEDPLFVRDHTGVQPTPKAATLLPKIAAVISMANDALMVEKTFESSTDTREIRVGAVEYTESLFAAELIRIFQKEAPRMRLTFVPMLRSEMIEMVSSYKVDLGIGSFNGEAPKIDVEIIFFDEYVVVCGKSSSWAGLPMTAEAYLTADHIGISSENQPQMALENLMTTMGTSRQIRVLLPHYMGAFGAVARTDCLLTIPRLLANQATEMFDLRIVPFPFAPPRPAISMLTHELARHDPALIWLKTKFREIAHRMQA